MRQDLFRLFARSAGLALVLMIAVPAFHGAALAQSVPAITKVEFAYDPDFSGSWFYLGRDDDTYPLAWTVSVRVTFDQNISVDLTYGKPSIELNIGGAQKQAHYNSASSREIIFFYRIQDGDEDADGISLDANKLKLNGAVITDASTGTLPANLNYTALPDDAGHKVDGVRPVFISAETSADRATIILTYNKPLSNLGSTPYYFKVYVNGDSRVVNTVSTNGYTVVLTLASAVAIGQTVTVSYNEPSVHDDKSIQSVVGTDIASLIEKPVTIPVTAAFSNAPAFHDGLTAFNVRLRFSEEVRLSYSAFTNGLLTTTGGTVGRASRLAPPSNIGWTFPVTPAGDDDVVITLPANRACAVQPTVCTPDGRPLARAASVAVARWASPDITGASGFTVQEGDTAVATLTAEDTDTDAGGLTWSLSDGADQAKFTITTTGALSFASAKDFEAPDDADTDGVYQVSVQVSDGGRTDTAALTVTLSNRNEAPTANAGDDQTDIVQDALVTLSGSGGDSDAGDTLSYAWTRTAGPAVELSGADTQNASFTAPTGLTADAVLTFTLTVTDAGGLYHEDSISVTVVTDEALTAAFSNAPAFHDGLTAFNVRLRFSEEVRLSYSAFTNGLLTTTGGTVGRASRLAPPSNIGWTFPVTPAGDDDVVITLPANRACAVQPTVCTPDGRPLARAASVAVARWASPDITGASGFTVQEGDTAVATLTAEDTDTDAGGLTWSLSDGADQAKFTITTTGALSFASAKDFEAPDDADTDGVYQVSVQVSDGGRTDTAALTVTLSNRNEAPTANAGDDQTDIVQDALVTLSGSGGDSDAGDTLSYAWTRTAGPAVELSGADTQNASFTAPTGLTADAVLTFTLTVTDAGGLYHEDTVSVTVKGPAPTPPLPSIAAGTTPVTEGTAATFTVSLDKAATEALSVVLTVAETGKMLSGAAPGTVAFAVGDRTKTLTFATSDDTVIETDSAVTVTLGTGSGYTLGTVASGSVIVEDNDTATWRVTAGNGAIEEDDSTAVTVEISNGKTFAAEQSISLTVSGTAAAMDYALSAITLTLPAGDASVSATLTALDDTDEESAETVTVTAAHGGSSIGSATVTIAANDTPLSDNATLSALTLSGIDIGTFANTTEDYTASVENAASSTTVTATPTDDGVSVTIVDGDGSTSGTTRTVSLAEGANTITVAVTAEDGVTTKRYTVMVTRASPTVAWGERLTNRDIESNAFSLVTGIWGEDGTVWVVANGSDGRVLAFDTEGNRVSSQDFRLRGSSDYVTDIWSDGTTVWAANVGGVNVGGVVAAYALEGGLPDTGKDLSSTLSAAGNEAPTGIWSDGTTVWLADYYGQKVYAYRLSDGARLRDKEFSLLDASQAVSPVGIWSDGETLLVNSWSEGKVYAFRLSDGERAPEKDIDTAVAGNVNPTGLWSDGETLWVGDDTMGKVFAYAAPGLSTATKN